MIRWFFFVFGAWVMVLISGVGLVLGASIVYIWWHTATVPHNPDICSECRWNSDRIE